METVDVLLRIGGSLVLLLGGWAGLYAARAGSRASSTAASLGRRAQEWTEIKETNAMLVQRAEDCEAREKELRAEFNDYRAVTSARIAHLEGIIERRHLQ